MLSGGNGKRDVNKVNSEKRAVNCLSEAKKTEPTEFRTRAKRMGRLLQKDVVAYYSPPTRMQITGPMFLGVFGCCWVV